MTAEHEITHAKAYFSQMPIKELEKLVGFCNKLIVWKKSQRKKANV